MISAKNIACFVYFLFLPEVCAFAPAVRVRPRSDRTSNDVVHCPHHIILSSFPVPSGRNGVFGSDCSTSNSRTKPRLASAIETMVQWLIKNVLFLQCSSLKVNMNASSNKAILNGNINKFSISARNCVLRFKLLSFQRLELYGDNLQLGYLPLLLPMVPFFLWRLRRYIQSTLITVFLLRMIGCLDGDSLQRYLGSMNRRIRHCIGSPLRPCISFSLALASSDVNSSLLLRFWLRNVLQSLVQNSVVGAAAAFGGVSQHSTEAERRRRNGSPLLIPGSATEMSSSLSPQDQEQQQGLTSSLLSATSFELQTVEFMLDQRIVFDANALLPKDENGATLTLQFCVRAKLAPTAIMETDGHTPSQQDGQEIHNAIGFLSPECRLATNPLYAPIGGNPLLRNLVSNLIPEYLWLPFGVGVAVPLANKCEIYRIGVDDSKEGSGYVCKIDGSVN